MDTTLIIPIISGAAFLGAIAVMVYMLWCGVTMRDSWLYQHFHPQAEANIGIRAIAITATASHSDPNSPPSNALDGNPATRWSSGVYMQVGMWFQLDLGAVHVTEGMLLDHRPSDTDRPEQWSVAISPDGQDWQTIVLGNGIIDALWPPANARYIRTTCDKPNNGWWWSIHEARVTYHALPPVIEPPPTPQPIPIPVPADEAAARAQVEKWALQYGWEGHSFTNIDFMKNTIITMEGYSWLKVDDDE